MTQEELDALPDVTPRFGQRETIIDGKRVVFPVAPQETGALFMGLEDSGEVRCGRTGQRWLVGQHNGAWVKRELGS